MGGACSTASGEVSARSDEDNLMRGHTEWCHMVSMTGMRAGCGANLPRAYRVRVVEGTYGALGPWHGAVCVAAWRSFGLRLKCVGSSGIARPHTAPLTPKRQGKAGIEEACKM